MKHRNSIYHLMSKKPHPHWYKKIKDRRKKYVCNGEQTIHVIDN